VKSLTLLSLAIYLTLLVALVLYGLAEHWFR